MTGWLSLEELTKTARHMLKRKQEAESCGENFNGWHCCLPAGHNCEHLAHTGVGGHVMAIWNAEDGDAVTEDALVKLAECRRDRDADADA